MCQAFDEAFLAHSIRCHVYNGSRNGVRVSPDSIRTPFNHICPTPRKVSEPKSRRAVHGYQVLAGRIPDMSSAV